MAIRVNVRTNQDTLASCRYHLSHCNAYMNGEYLPNYPVPAIRHDICYWDCGGISISVPGECEHRYIYGRAFGYGIRINHWEP